MALVRHLTEELLAQPFVPTPGASLQALCMVLRDEKRNIHPTLPAGVPA